MSAPVRLLLVDDDKVDRRAVLRHLESTGLDAAVREATTGVSGLTTLDNARFDCVLLDYLLPDMDGIRFAAELKSREDRKHLPIVMLTGRGSESIAVAAMKQGIQDYLVKDNMTGELLAGAITGAIEAASSWQEQQAARRRLEEMALQDHLTNLGNRNLFHQRLEHGIARASRQDETICLLLIDLDGFKEVNDTYGHLAGDEVLRQVGRRLEATVRRADTVARLGGDEFAILMETGCTLRGAAALAQKIDEVVRKPIVVDGLIVRIGLSLGIAVYPDHGMDQQTLLQNADTAMYVAKRGGDRIKLYSATELLARAVDK